MNETNQKYIEMDVIVPADQTPPSTLEEISVHESQVEVVVPKTQKLKEKINKSLEALGITEADLIEAKIDIDTINRLYDIPWYRQAESWFFNDNFIRKCFYWALFLDKNNINIDHDKKVTGFFNKRFWLHGNSLPLNNPSLAKKVVMFNHAAEALSVSTTLIYTLISIYTLSLSPWKILLTTLYNGRYTGGGFFRLANQNLARILSGTLLGAPIILAFLKTGLSLTALKYLPENIQINEDLQKKSKISNDYLQWALWPIHAYRKDIRRSGLHLLWNSQLTSEQQKNYIKFLIHSSKKANYNHQIEAIETLYHITQTAKIHDLKVFYQSGGASKNQMIDLIHLRTAAYQTLAELSQYQNIKTPHKKIRALRRFLATNYYLWLAGLSSRFLLPLLFYLPRAWPMYMQISSMISFFEILSSLKLYIDCKREGGFVYFRAGDLNIPADYFFGNNQINRNINLACICLDPSESISFFGDYYYNPYLYVDFSSDICKSVLISTSKTEAQLKNRLKKYKNPDFIDLDCLSHSIALEKSLKIINELKPEIKEVRAFRAKDYPYGYGCHANAVDKFENDTLYYWQEVLKKTYSIISADYNGEAFESIISIIDQTPIEKMSFYFKNSLYDITIDYNQNIKNSSLKYFFVDTAYDYDNEKDLIKNLYFLFNQTNIEYLGLGQNFNDYSDVSYATLLSESLQSFPKLSFLNAHPSYLSENSFFSDTSFLPLMKQQRMLGLVYNADSDNDLSNFCLNITSAGMQFFKINMNYYNSNNSAALNCLDQAKKIKQESQQPVSDFMRKTLCYEMTSIVSPSYFLDSDFNEYLPPVKDGANFDESQGYISYLNPNFCSSSASALTPPWPFELIGKSMRNAKLISNVLYQNADNPFFILLSFFVMIRLFCGNHSDKKDVLYKNNLFKTGFFRIKTEKINSLHGQAMDLNQNLHIQ